MKLVNIYNNCRTLYLFCRNDEGKQEIITKNDFFPYFYEFSKEGKSISYNGIPLKKIFVSNPSDVPKNRTDGAFEADILFTKRYMIDKIDKLEKCPIKYCLHPDTFIQTNNGIKLLKEIKVGDKLKSLNQRRTLFTNVVKAKWNTYKETFKVKTKNGEILSSKDHKFYCIENDRNPSSLSTIPNFYYKELKKFKKRDYLIILRNYAKLPNNWKKIDWFWLLGYLFGDGSYQNSKNLHCNIFEPDINIVEEIQRISNNYNITYNINQAKNRIEIHDNKFKDMINEKLKTRNIEFIFEYPLDYKISFVAGFFDAEGSVENNYTKTITISNTNKKIIYWISNLLWSLGITNSIITIPKRKNKLKSYNLHILNDKKFKKIFITLIASNKKRQKLAKLHKINYKIDMLPIVNYLKKLVKLSGGKFKNYKLLSKNNIHRERANQILQQLDGKSKNYSFLKLFKRLKFIVDYCYFSKIKYIKSMRKQKLIDITLEGKNGNFNANNFHCHNCFVDIEVLSDELPNVQEAKHTISCISTYNSFSKSIETFYLKDYETEYKMMEAFISYMQKEKFDLLLGWNVKFDYNYLYNRFLDFAEKISPIGQIRYGDGEVYYPAGVSIVDYLAWMKKITLNRESEYSLDYIAQKYLKQPPKTKIDFGKLSPELKARNIRDVKNLVELEEKFKLIPYFDEIRRISKVEWEDMIWTSRVHDMLLLQEAKNQGVVLPMKPDERRGTLSEKEEFEGAYRRAFKTGAFTEGVGVYDLSSCYPSMIIDFALDPANIIEKEGNEIKTGHIINGIKFNQNPKALLPTITKKLMILKNDIKKKLSTLKVDTPEYKDTKMIYTAVKGIVNASFGIFGNRFFRLYNRNVASTITFLVRDLLQYIINFLKSKGYDVIYCDTDGLMIDKNKEDISDLLNKTIKQWAKEKYNKDDINTEFEYEGNFEKILIFTKCRYVGYLRKPNGELEKITKGVEIRRKDSTQYMKKFQKELVDKILNKEDKIAIFAWIKEQIAKFKDTPLEDIAFPCKLSKKAEDYKNVPIWVRASQYANELVPEFGKKIGDLFYYIYVKSNEYEEKTKTIQYLDGRKLTPSCLKSAWKEHFKEDILVKDMDKKKKEELIEHLVVAGKITNKTEFVKGKNKNVMAFNSEYKDHVKNVDWEMMLNRNIFMKLSTIFEAMKWDIKKIMPNSVETKDEVTEYIEKTKSKPIDKPKESKVIINSKAIRLFEMFAGYGGASFALKKANIPFKCIGYSEIKPHAIEVYNLNHPNIKYQGDCTKIIPQDLPNFNLLTGGFPCQDVSMAGKHDLSKGRTLLFNDILRIAQFKRPKYMLLENVKGLTFKNHEKMFNYILTSLDLIGYKVHWKVLSSLDYNTPQKRERVYFVCFRKDIYKGFSFPPKEVYTNDWKNYVDDSKNFKKVNKTPSRDIMKKKCKNITNSPYSYTITLKQDRYPNAGIIDFEDYYRFLTTREQFRLQGFFEDEIKLPNLPNSKLQDLAGDGWDINLVSKIFKKMFK